MKLRSFIRIVVAAAVAVIMITAPYCLAADLRDESWAANTCKTCSKKEKRLHDKVSLSYYTENSFKYSQVTFGNHIEYDLTDSITLFNSIYYKYIRSEYSYSVYDEFSLDGSYKTNVLKGDVYGLDDIDIGLKQRLLNRNFGIFTHKFRLTVPGPYDENETLPLGSGDYNIYYSLIYGYSFQRYYFNWETGYRWRSGGLSSQIYYSAGIVTKVTSGIRLRVKVNGRSSLDNGDEENTQTDTGTSTERSYRTITPFVCGGDGGGFTSDTSVNDSTDDRFSDLILSLGLRIKLTDKIGLNFNYRPGIHMKNMSEDTSFSVSIFYWLI